MNNSNISPAVIRPEHRKECPSHPGAVLKWLYLEELNISVSSFAAGIGVSRKAVSMIVNGRKSVTPEMALRFGKALDTDPRLWLNLQTNYDLWQANHREPGLLDSIKKIAAVL